MKPGSKLWLILIAVSLAAVSVTLVPWWVAPSSGPTETGSTPSPANAGQLSSDPTPLEAQPDRLPADRTSDATPRSTVDSPDPAPPVGVPKAEFVTIDDLLRVLEESPPEDVLQHLLALIRELDPDARSEDRRLLGMFSPHLTMYAKDHPELLPEFRRIFRDGSVAAQVMSMSPVRHAAAIGQLDGVMDDFVEVYSRSESPYLQLVVLQNCGSLHESEAAVELIGSELGKSGPESMRGVALSLTAFDSLLRSEALVQSVRRRLGDGVDHPLVRRYPSARDCPQSLSVITGRLIERAAHGDLASRELAQIVRWIQQQSPGEIDALIAALGPLSDVERNALSRANVTVR